MAKKFNWALPADPCSTEEADNYYNTLISKHLSKGFIDRLLEVNSQAIKASEVEAQKTKGRSSYISENMVASINATLKMIGREGRQLSREDMLLIFVGFKFGELVGLNEGRAMNLKTEFLGALLKDILE